MSVATRSPRLHAELARATAAKRPAWSATSAALNFVPVHVEVLAVGIGVEPRLQQPRQRALLADRDPRPTCRTAASTRCSTCFKGSGTERHVHLPRPDATDPYDGGRRRTSGPSTATACCSRPAGHLHPGGLHDDLWVDRAGRDRPPGRRRARASPTPRTCSRRSRTTTSPPAPCRWDVVDVARPSPTGACTVHKGDMLSTSTRRTTRSSRRGTSRWGSWSSGWPTATDGDPIRHQRPRVLASLDLNNSGEVDAKSRSLQRHGPLDGPGVGRRRASRRRASALSASISAPE